MGKYIVASELGERRFNKEEDATDYQIRILSQAGVSSTVSVAGDICENCGDECGATAPYGTDCRLAPKPPKEDE